MKVLIALSAEVVLWITGVKGEYISNDHDDWQQFLHTFCQSVITNTTYIDYIATTTVLQWPLV